MLLSPITSNLAIIYIQIKLNVLLKDAFDINNVNLI